MHNCPSCGKETGGAWSEGGARWALCEDCMGREESNKEDAAMCFFHKWKEVDGTKCGKCWAYHLKVQAANPEKWPNPCPHGIKVCSKCGEFKGWGSHGRLHVIPDMCEEQVEYMRAGVTHDNFYHR